MVDRGGQLSRVVTGKLAAVFLDRDGVLNEEVGNLSRVEELRLLPGAARAVKRLNALDIPAVIVTNQSVVARGFCTEDDVHEIHRALRRMLASAGARIDHVYHCPHHPEGLGRYRVDCACRKPKPGLLLQAARDFHIDLRRTAMIGDQVADMQAGWEAGCRTVLVLTGYGMQALERLKASDRQPDHIAADLEDAVDWYVRDLETTRCVGG